MAQVKLSSETWVPIGAVLIIIAFISGGIWWAASTTEQVSQIQNNVEEQAENWEKTNKKVEDIQQEVSEANGRLEAVMSFLGVRDNQSISKK